MSPKQEHKDQALAHGHSPADLDGAHNEWKFRAPYRVHAPAEDGFEVHYEAACHCGRVQYQLGRARPLDAKYCHCRTCQTLHGAPFQWAAIFHKTDINFTRGHHDLSWYDPSSQEAMHHLPCKVSCAHCRAPVMDEGRNMILLFPSLIRFAGKEERERFAPSCHIFYEQRCLDINDGKPKWAGMNGKSELIADSPPEVGEKRKRTNGDAGEPE